LIVLLHMFRKDTGELPRREIELAKQRWVDFKERMDAQAATAATGSRPRRPVTPGCIIYQNW
jgi:hypothetical protein